MEKDYFNYTLQPGRELDKIEYEEQDPIISVIMPFYNDKSYIEQAVNCVLNQTFPLFEFLIIDDGSTDNESLRKLEQIEKMDKRIKVFHKKNEGLSATRDFGASKSSNCCKYLMFLDSDDLIEKTYLECGYWTLETNTDASWAYTDSVGFEKMEYRWSKLFDAKQMKKVNDLTSACIIRKEDFFEVNGYELREKAVNEDWNFWLKLMAKGKFPVKMNFYGMWYRRKEQGELAKSRENKKRAMEIIKNTAKMIQKDVTAIQYPKQDYNWDGIVENVATIKCTQNIAKNKINILMMIPWMVTGGADKFNLDLISRLDKNRYHVIILLTEPNVNVYRQEFEQHATVYDLTTFLDQKYWIAFINYIIKKENINLIFNTNSKYGYEALPYLKTEYPEIPIVDYIHMEEWYNRNGGYSRDSSAVSSVIDKTLVCNKNTQRILEEHFKRNKEDIETVYIGVNEQEFNPELYNKEELLQKYDIETNKKYIISYICRIAEQKRPLLFLEIIKKLKEDRDDFIVLVAGDGNLLPKLKSEVKKLKLDGIIKFLGNVTKTKEIYAMSDLTINCSIKEGLALTSYESLSMGVPVVSSDVGGQKELINDKVGAIVPCLQQETEIMNFKYSEEEINYYVSAIKKILNNLEYYKSNARKRILDGFTIDQMVDKMSTIFEQTVSSPKQEKIENGKNMKKMKDVTKELINLSLISNKGEYLWLCNQYNSKCYGIEIDKWEYIKNRLWEKPLWRVFIRFLQKTGIMKLMKRNGIDQKVKDILDK
ncbi:MAG: glycosyltransferase [Clostridia bacterium]|nr:glycosyltransferase [Clostridia bacterium]